MARITIGASAYPACVRCGERSHRSCFGPSGVCRGCLGSWPKTPPQDVGTELERDLLHCERCGQWLRRGPSFAWKRDEAGRWLHQCCGGETWHDAVPDLTTYDAFDVCI